MNPALSATIAVGPPACLLVTEFVRVSSAEPDDLYVARGYGESA